MRQSSEVPQILQARITRFASSLPSNPTQKQNLVSKYQSLRGYQFLNPASKLHRLFLQKYSSAVQHRSQNLSMENQLSCTEVGAIDQLSVGAMCEVVKENLRQGAYSYQPEQGGLEAREFTYSRDEELFGKTVHLLHRIQLGRMEQKANASSQLYEKMHGEDRAMDRVAESRRQMTAKQDGSMGMWGGKKYQGLGSQNQFTTFRREQSINYYQNTHAPPHKKP